MYRQLQDKISTVSVTRREINFIDTSKASNWRKQQQKGVDP